MASRPDENPLAPGRRLAAAAAALLLLVMTGGAPAGAQTPQVKAPVPTVPEIFTLQGAYVRTAYNNEGFANLGYRTVQQEVGKDWVLLAVGITVRKGAPDQKLKRENLWLTTPDGKKIPLATQQQYAAANLRALNMRAKVVTDSINYFPVDANRACAIKFFADLDSAFPLAYDEVELSSTRACVGRLYFNVPGGIQVGQHWLNIQFAGSELQVPFRTLTKEDEKLLEKNWDDFKKALDAQLKD